MPVGTLRAASAKAKRKTQNAKAKHITQNYRPSSHWRSPQLRPTTANQADAARSVPTLTVISSLSFPHLIPLCGLDFAHARQNQVRLASTFDFVDFAIARHSSNKFDSALA
jgi:hypothetical protein